MENFVVGPTNPCNPTDQGKYSMVQDCTGEMIPQLEVGNLRMTGAVGAAPSYARTHRVRGGTEAGIYTLWISEAGEHYLFNMASVMVTATDLLGLNPASLPVAGDYAKAVPEAGSWIPKVQATKAYDPAAPADVQAFWKCITGQSSAAAFTANPRNGNATVSGASTRRH